MALQNKLGPMDVEVWFRSEISRISPLVDRLIRLIELAGCVPGEETEVEIAIREAVSNAVIHGNRMDPRKRVHVVCRCTPGNGVSIVVGDEGQGFDPNLLPDVVGAESEHGRGILLMKFYMDEVSFEKNGTEVHMQKASTHTPRTASKTPHQTTDTKSASCQHHGAVIVGAGQERGVMC